MPYREPDPDIVAIVDAPPTPLARLAPGGKYVVLVGYETYPPVSLLAKPYLALAGVRVDPAIAGRQRTRRLVGFDVLHLEEPGSAGRIDLPPQASVSAPVWSPDGRRFAFTVDQADGIGVWLGDAETLSARPVPGLSVRDILGGDPLSPWATVHWSRDGQSLIALASPAPPQRLTETIEPRLEETVGKHTQMATFQDLLHDDADADAFEVLATTVPVRVDPVTGGRTELGAPGLYLLVDESPDRQWLLVHRLRRPFSFRVPYPYFARVAEVRTSAGELARLIADLPVSDEVPRHGVPTGPRAVCWAEAESARLVWAEALDGGDPRAEAENRDQVMTLAAPFDGEPTAAFRVRQRCLGWLDLPEPGGLLLTEHDRDRRWLTTWLCDLADPARNRVLFDRSHDDAYGDPGTPLLTVTPDGRRTILSDGPVTYLRGDGASPEGDRPFLDRLDLSTAGAAARRLFRCPPDAFEQVVGFAGKGRNQLVVWRESTTDPPNLILHALESGDRVPLTGFADPHPQVAGMTKRLITHDRGDGVALTGMLHLPPGYDADRDGRLPLLIWAYPYDFADAGTAGQVRGSDRRFTRLLALGPVWFVLRGFAVLAEATMPVIGDPETMNDSYVEQVCAAAAAHVGALDDMGLIDRARVAVGGHSYGAFMTANLLAHTDLFAAGIARSGAYNRSLTPFGFQTERRNFWEATQVYDRVSPVRYADKITAPLLLIHGERDANSGTFPIQSERLFQAIGGNGGTARLVILPYENHGYLARESVLHVLAEQFGWLARWCG